MNTKQTLLITGPAGQQELLITHSPESRAITCIICHPHPVYGGTMHNKVVFTLASTMEALKVKTVRFNFRGVQKSEGVFDNGIGELDDLIMVVNWVKAQCPNDEIWLAGFSFGAFIALKGHQDCGAQCLITVAPPVGQAYFENIPKVVCPWILVQGGKDEIIASDKVLSWVQNQSPAPEMLYFPEAGHFFHGQLVEMKDNLLNLLGRIKSEK